MTEKHGILKKVVALNFLSFKLTQQESCGHVPDGCCNIRRSGRQSPGMRAVSP